VKAAVEMQDEGGGPEQAQEGEVRGTVALSEFQEGGSVAREKEDSARGLARREGEERAGAVPLSEAEPGKERRRRRRTG
jgi:hypothetical protein